MWMFLLIAMNVVILAMLVRSLKDTDNKHEENEYKHAVQQLFKSNSNINTTKKKAGL